MPYRDSQAQAEYQRLWRAERRAAWFGGKQCAQCGGKDRLELDHIDRTSKVSHSVWSWSDKRRAEELAKCQALCHDCHLQKTAKDLDYAPPRTAPASTSSTAAAAPPARLRIARKPRPTERESAWRYLPILC